MARFLGAEGLLGRDPRGHSDTPVFARGRVLVQNLLDSSESGGGPEAFLQPYLAGCREQAA